MGVGYGDELCSGKHRKLRDWVYFIGRGWIVTTLHLVKYLKCYRRINQNVMY